jgi:competence ComEA-like helix-hairpin-helix protein
LKFFDHIQKFFGIAKGEALVSFIILLGLVIGLVYHFNSSDDTPQEFHKKTIEQLLVEIDSLAELQKQQYIGSDSAGNPREIPPGSKYQKKLEMKTLKVNINTDSKVQLMKLPGIGEKTALKILKYRTETKFTSIEDIMNIKGIGQKKFENMQTYIVVD